jgi:hypothetical protein
VKGYPLRQLYEEMAFIAYHFHWPPAELAALEHWERRGWCQEISMINRKLDDRPRNPIEIE